MSNSNKHPIIKPLTILHTSDWHLGRRLYGQMRYDEFQAFLNWLTETIEAQKVDVLIVAGDIFDTMTPSNRAQSLYYQFLGTVSSLYCEHVVIVSGNHDSPTFLDAPANVLKFLNVHVIGTACENIEDEVLVLKDKNNQPQCVIAAVPYLRDRDVRSSQAGESGQDKDANVLTGINQHYDKVAEIAKAKQSQLIEQHNYYVPIIATGHLFTAGGRTTEDDGVRDLYVGSLGKVSVDMFDKCFDYVALGHLHVPQKVGNCEHIRYSGSPIAMGFGEARQQKQVLLIQFAESVSLDSFITQPLKSEPLAELSSSAPNNQSSNEQSSNDKLSNNKPSKSTASKKDSFFVGDLFADLEEDLDDGLNLDSSLNDKLDDASENEFHIDSNETWADEVITHSPSTEQIKLLHSDDDKQMHVISLAIPCFQKLQQISGDLQQITSHIQQLPKSESIWLEVIYKGDEVVSDLREQIHALIEDTSFDVLKIKNINVYNKILTAESTSETLQDLNEQQVFERCLTLNKIPDSQRPSLLEAYSEILHEIHHEDKMAE
ncbi:exonuclease SbcCD subunit D C-terminal domain-containing protein [Psychrobacter sanguinis]|uniref:exonuclease SbcCD subunit D C-terminal domain-containing protein n=1 Tax=Psychrobacter sanguinis TaxID=861445 RepID=UPI00191B6A28|nr:exonuclease SbcCD subunit D C-terminal domain-containing protein [Psychrobacter sanguinis]MCC3307849.1 exonuclease SbcCD subunit D C-terminal domain-containing protein [Psychrobacter sanguinis]UEC25147.1 exonuclease SbcCD subunit D C-terminal domain-containing protein [Psychrobacter sanguinis]